jgi:hypothetical protein
MELYQEYTDICQKYVDGFAKKQGLTFERWAGDVVGDTAVFSKSYFYRMERKTHWSALLPMGCKRLLYTYILNNFDILSDLYKLVWFLQ